MKRTITGALAALAMLTGCQSLDSSGSTAVKPAKSHSAPKAEPSKSAPTPDPKGTFRQSCNYLLGNFTDFSQGGYRFTADVTLHNTGNIGTVDRVIATWDQAGGRNITKVKMVRLKAGRQKRTGFIVPASGDQIDQYQNLGYGSNCHVKVAMISTFGKAR